MLFDVDGVLVDSERFIALAAVRMFAELHGVAVDPAEFAPFIGTGEGRYLGGVAAAHGIDLDVEKAKARTYALYFEVIRGRLRTVPGAVELVRALRAAGARIAIATSADRGKLDANLREAGLCDGDFDAVLTGLDVERKKPFPDIYLEAARRIGVPPEDCLVIEDAPEGILAGIAAGARCAGVSTSFPAERLFEAGAAFVLPDLTGGIAALERRVSDTSSS
ncbi:MAG: HAD-IA family hydrolase [Spirochaetes bacterium]|nr:HAD-IA family hydrolase [Spirochaetota bacterium]